MDNTLENVTIIHTYSRAQAIEDGMLVDVSQTAQEAGITYPVALTSALHADINNIPERNIWQSYEGRLWDVLWMLAVNIKLRPEAAEGDVLLYHLTLSVPGRRSSTYRVKSVCGPGDDAEPVITLMKTDED